jgi:hypothetical protein
MPIFMVMQAPEVAVVVPVIMAAAKEFVTIMVL